MDHADEIRTGEALDWAKLQSYLREELPELDGDMSVAQFHGGHANLTYLITFGNSEYVLRRPPFGKIAPGAHDMKREYNVLSRLYAYFPQAPRAFLYCDNPEIIGAHFVLMERKQGIVVRTGVPRDLAGFDNVEERLSQAMIRAEADLHRVDVAAAGLSDLGKPEGFLERQLAGWGKRWHLSKTEDVPAVDETLAILQGAIPVPQAVSIVHNDIKFDNCQFQPENPDEVSALFDWDMTTIGDPLADLGMTLSYWPDQRIAGFDKLPILVKGDFPDKQWLIDQYRDRSGFDLSALSWYESLSFLKLAVISQQLYKRFVDGSTKDQRMKHFGISAQILVGAARQFAQRV